MNTGKVILSIAVGVAAGAVIGVLLAPDKGSETRKKISDKGNEFADELKSKFSDFVESVLDKCDQLKCSAEDLAHKGMKKTEEMKDEMNSQPLNQQPPVG